MKIVKYILIAIPKGDVGHDVRASDTMSRRDINNIWYDIKDFGITAVLESVAECIGE